MLIGLALALAPHISKVASGVSPQASSGVSPQANSGVSPQASSGVSPQAAPGVDPQQALWRGVDARRAQLRVRELVALGPRMGGTRSGDAAAEYVSKAFAELGLEVRVVETPERRTWQPLAWTLSARVEGSQETAHKLERAWPWQNSPDAKGSALLTLESAPDVAWLTERAGRGASTAAVILASRPTNSDGSWPVPGRLRDGAAQACFGIAKPEADLLRGWLESGAKVRVEFELDAETRNAPIRTVVARLPGRKGGEAWKSPYFLFCAPGDADSGGPGADDNASGVATVLEIASAWKRAIDAGALAPAHEVRFAIWGSEIESTRHFLETRVPADGELLGVINYDQSGFGSGADQVNIEPDDLPGNVALVNALVTVMRARAPRDASTPGDFPARFATNKSLGGTDSYVFSGSELFKTRALPSISVFSSAWGAAGEHKRTSGMPGESWRERDKVSVDYDLYYHSSGDTPENTTDKEPWNMAWCARVGLLGAESYLEALP